MINAITYHNDYNKKHLAKKMPGLYGEQDITDLEMKLVNDVNYLRSTVLPLVTQLSIDLQTTEVAAIIEYHFKGVVTVKEKSKKERTYSLPYLTIHEQDIDQPAINLKS